MLKTLLKQNLYTLIASLKAKSIWSSLSSEFSMASDKSRKQIIAGNAVFKL
jgi:hypothetical protein